MNNSQVFHQNKRKKGLQNLKQQKHNRLYFNKKLNPKQKVKCKTLKFQIFNEKNFFIKIILI